MGEAPDEGAAERRVPILPRGRAFAGHDQAIRVESSKNGRYRLCQALTCPGEHLLRPTVALTGQRLEAAEILALSQETDGAASCWSGLLLERP